MLKGDEKKAARKVLGTINKLNIENEKSKKELYKSTILGFESLRHRNKLSYLNEINESNLEDVLAVFSDLDMIESLWYYEITRSRLEVIHTLKQKINDDEKEKFIQQYIYNHLWLLDPAWDKATSPSPSMEEQVKLEFENVTKGLPAEEKNIRFDIRYCKTEGKHVIIELKRASVKVNQGQITTQLLKYKKALKDLLHQDPKEKSSTIDCIALLGNLPSEWSEQVEIDEGRRALASQNIRVITYNELLNNAESMYQDYLEKSQKISQLSKILDEISKWDADE